jgi:hypothetical protein
MKLIVELIPKYKVVVLTVILLSMGFKHPMHVTVTEVEYDQSSKSIEMSIHVFWDDIERHIRRIKNDDQLDLMGASQEGRDQLLKTYLGAQVKLNINERQYTPSYLGHEVEGEAIWVFMEVSNVKKLKVLEVSNTILFDIYNDQANLVHFEHDGDVYSEKLDKGNKNVVYDLANL